MKPGAILINTSRGPLVDEDALVAALEAGRIFAGLDVFDREPLAPGDRMRRLPNTVLTPHLGYCVAETLRQFYAQSVENALAFLDGAPHQSRQSAGIAWRMTRRTTMSGSELRQLIERGDVKGVQRALAENRALANQTIHWVVNQANESDPLHYVSDCVYHGWLTNGKEGEIASVCWRTAPHSRAEQNGNRR